MLGGSSKDGTRTVINAFIERRASANEQRLSQVLRITGGNENYLHYVAAESRADEQLVDE